MRPRPRATLLRELSDKVSHSIHLVGQDTGEAFGVELSADSDTDLVSHRGNSAHLRRISPTSGRASCFIARRDGIR
jgi:hypothetical protein